MKTNWLNWQQIQNQNKLREFDLSELTISYDNKDDSKKD